MQDSFRHKKQKIIKNMSVMYQIWTDKKKINIIYYKQGREKPLL